MFKGERRYRQKRDTKEDKHFVDIKIAKLKTISFIESVNIF